MEIKEGAHLRLGKNPLVLADSGHSLFHISQPALGDYSLEWIWGIIKLLYSSVYVTFQMRPDNPQSINCSNREFHLNNILNRPASHLKGRNRKSCSRVFLYLGHSSFPPLLNNKF